MLFKTKQKIEALQKVYLDLQERISTLENEVSVLRNYLDKGFKEFRKIGILSETNSGRLSNLELRISKLEAEIYKLGLELQLINEKISEAGKEEEKGKKKEREEVASKKGKREKREGKEKARKGGEKTRARKRPGKKG